MWKNVYRIQLTVEGVTRLKNCFPNRVIHMQAIYYEDILKSRSIQPERSKLGVPKLKILAFQKELKESTKNKKITERIQTLNLEFQSNAKGSTNIVAQNESQNTHESRKRKRKAKRIPNSEEESLLEPLILSQNELTNEQMKEKLNTLSNE
ncbi:2943_t:CDS:1 [Funneliformis caledonium]|uniref:2943_t:CDS:1 n=1 Tax=Funneliformis caledonium TaxID=1117310 RepID=A0A9N9NBX0_9GLOM|nr:2943_t:CDS:1 [Funneliformis caledonium]